MERKYGSSALRQKFSAVLPLSIVVLATIRPEALFPKFKAVRFEYPLGEVSMSYSTRRYSTVRFDRELRNSRDHIARHLHPYRDHVLYPAEFKLLGIRHSPRHFQWRRLHK
jgi:hypothetical protein